jgi:hypothetical protein
MAQESHVSTSICSVRLERSLVKQKKKKKRNKIEIPNKIGHKQNKTKKIEDKIGDCFVFICPFAKTASEGGKFFLFS